MSYIPNIREKFEKNIITGETKNDENGYPIANAYWEGYLKEDDAREIYGIDTAISEIDNLLAYNAEHFDDYAEILGIEEGMLTEKECEFVFEDNTDVLSLSEKDMNNYSKKALFMKALKQAIIDWFEIVRDETGVSMIDNMDEDEYEARVKEVDKDGDQNILLRCKINNDQEGE